MFWYDPHTCGKQCQGWAFLNIPLTYGQQTVSRSGVRIKNKWWGNIILQNRQRIVSRLLIVTKFLSISTQKTSWGKYWRQGRSQPHSTGWARAPLSSFFPSNFDQFILFFLKLYSFSSSFWFSGWAARPPGKALATPLTGGIWSEIEECAKFVRTRITNSRYPDGHLTDMQ